MSTVANMVIAPVQDILGLDSEGYINRPGILDGNRTWRLTEGMLTPEVMEQHRALTKIYARD